jgi:hypothetical protein
VLFTVEHAPPDDTETKFSLTILNPSVLCHTLRPRHIPPNAQILVSTESARVGSEPKKKKQETNTGDLTAGACRQKPVGLRKSIEEDA